MRVCVCRECPFLLQLLNEIVGAPFYPQLIMIDGNGVLHPRGFGLACQLGVLADVPTLGALVVIPATSVKLHC